MGTAMVTSGLSGLMFRVSWRSVKASSMLGVPGPLAVSDAPGQMRALPRPSWATP